MDLNTRSVENREREFPLFLAVDGLKTLFRIEFILGNRNVSRIPHSRIFLFNLKIDSLLFFLALTTSKDTEFVFSSSQMGPVVESPFPINQ